MSKPDLPGGQSLEEILASIRKTLADDRPDEGLAKLDNLQAVAEEPVLKVNGTAPHGDTLPNRLADALNGAVAGHAEEQDLADLLASELPGPAQDKKSNGLNGLDPPWFLSPRVPMADSNVKPAAARAETRAPAQPEEIALTRPETLRRSFPPLFGGGEAVTARPADIPFDRPKPMEPPAAKPVQAEEAPVLPTPVAPAADKPLAAAVASPELVADPDKSIAAIQARFRAAAEPTLEAKPAVVLPEPAVEVAVVPVSRDLPAADAVAEFKAAPAEEPAAPAESAAEPQVDPAAAAGLQGQPLQEVIARLLEPVIQQWLDANLPRMVEAAIREEVGRQMRGQRGEIKI